MLVYLTLIAVIGKDTLGWITRKLEYLCHSFQKFTWKLVDSRRRRGCRYPTWSPMVTNASLKMQKQKEIQCLIKCSSHLHCPSNNQFASGLKALQRFITKKGHKNSCVKSVKLVNIFTVNEFIFFVQSFCFFFFFLKVLNFKTYFNFSFLLFF